MKKRDLLGCFMRATCVKHAISLVAAIQAGPIWPKVTVAAGWDTRGYTDWSDGTRTFRPPLKLEVDVLFGQVLPVARYYRIPVQDVLAMSFRAFHRYLDAMPREVLFS